MRYFINLSYNGTHYFGYQRQPQQISIQEVLEKALSVLLQEGVRTIGAGRTDTGVHAKEIYAHFDYRKPLPENLVKRINAYLPKDIAIQSIVRVTDTAHARFDALRRTYQYKISIYKNPFRQEFHAQFLYYKFDITRMNEAASILFKYTDFTSFSRLHTDNKTNECVIYNAHWEQKNNELIFTITANRFLRNMVRAIVGTLIDVGRGKLSVKDFERIIRDKDRKSASASAPAQGLVLIRIEYPENIFI